MPEELTLNISVSLFNILLTIILLFINRKKYEKYYYSHHFRALTSSAISIFLIFCIIALINYMGFKHTLYWDFSLNKVNSLSSQTTNLLKKINEDVTFYVFTTRSNAKNILDFIELYHFKNSKIKSQYIDIELHPELVTQFNVTAPNSVVIGYQQKKITVQDLSEKSFTNALIRLTREKDPLIYYSSGHEEISLSDDSSNGLSVLNQAIEDYYYKINKVNLATLEKIPSEVDILMLWGGKNGLVESEIALIDNFIRRGGKLLVAIDPNPNKDNAFPLRELISRWGININNDLVVDKIEHISGSNGTVPLIKNFSSEHKITRGFQGQVFFPLVSSVSNAGSSKEGKFESFAFSSPYPASWGETNLNELFDSKITFNEGVDGKGPISVAATWEENSNSSQKAKIVAFGNSTFVINSYGKFGNNFQLLLNSMSWLMDDGDVHSSILENKSGDQILIGKTAIGIIFYFSVLFAPIVCFVTAGYIYNRRRKL